eukprot:GGOE01000692.1.p1 GENE.GGOE01000692.1~~GGOE01000692.1.p1  ORF type:complete len:335 (+),score=98.49 GGOE01000692.1:81-1085(+)
MGIGAKMNALAAYQANPPPPATESWLSPESKAFLQNQILAKLTSIVEQHTMQALYNGGRLAALAERVSGAVNFHEVAEQWHLPLEVALDLCSLALYDIVIYADDSGSMKGRNWDEDLKLIVQRTAAIACLFDDDGISVRFMNAKVDRDHVRTEKDVMDLLMSVRPSNGTPMGTSMKTKVVEPFISDLRKMKGRFTAAKPLLVITVTDGAPSGEPTNLLFKVIRRCREDLVDLGLSGNEVAFQFAQVGTDPSATEFLDNLDNHPQIGQFVDATQSYEQEAQQWAQTSKGELTMTRDLYLLKLLCGAIDGGWDSRDAKAAGSCPGTSEGKKDCVLM